MSYKALYRTYRPQTFKEVVGQDVVVRTLQNAIANNKISHAYLFAGLRGTGKTTIARIFAKALNCHELDNNEPCNKCISCQEISNSLSPDVIEIDAASNNGVDEIREIREKVKFLPVGAKYKIYIIDEVHMLSAGAFNALLKTLEEPPKHVVFILATTEPQKLPATIISRCQRFDFKSITVKEISSKIKEVVNEENIKISDEAINVISEAAEGGMRDALSILDQAISYADDEVTIEEVNLVTGNLSYDKLIELGNCFNEKNLNRALEIVDDLISMGKEVSKLVNNLIQFYRDMLLYQNTDSPAYAKFIFEKEAFKKLARETNPKQIFYYLDNLSDVQGKIKYSPTPRIYLEMAIVKLINMGGDEVSILSRLAEVENKIANVDLNGLYAPEVDNEKITTIEFKLNRVISELSKLELHKLSERINNLEVTKGALVASDNSELNHKLNQLEDSLLILKTSLNNLINKVDTSISPAPLNDNLEHAIKNMQMDLDSLKVQLVKVENSKFDFNETVITDIKERINTLEKRVYNLVSSDLASKAAPAKKAKNVGKQIGLFDEDAALSKDEFSVDFKNLTKTEDDKFDDQVDENEEVEAEENDFVEEVKSETEVKVEEAPKVEEPKEDIKMQTEEAKVNLTSKVTPTADVVDVKVNNEDPVNVHERCSSYDVKVIEGILHESRTEAARNDAKRINQLWINLGRGISPELMGVVETLREGKIAAVGNKELILVFSSSTLCNQVMRPRFKNDAMKILYDQLGDTYNYMALPDHIWQAKRTEYVNQYNIGIKYPKLTPIADDDLVIINKENEYKDPKDKIIDQVKELFGDDIVKVE